MPNVDKSLALLGLVLVFLFVLLLGEYKLSSQLKEQALNHQTVYVAVSPSPSEMASVSAHQKSK